MQQELEVEEGRSRGKAVAAVDSRAWSHLGVFYRRRHLGKGTRRETHKSTLSCASAHMPPAVMYTMYELPEMGTQEV